MVISPSRVVVVTHRILTVALYAVVAFAVLGAPLFLVMSPDTVTIGDTVISDPSRAEAVVVFVLLLGFAALVVIGLQQLRGLVGSVLAGEPFAEENIRRARILAGLFFARMGLQFVSTLVASQFVDGEGVSILLDVQSVVSGLCVLVLAEVFAHGIRLRAEIEGTV